MLGRSPAAERRLLFFVSPLQRHMHTGEHQVRSASPFQPPNPPERRLRVFVLSDVRLYSDGLTSLLAREPRLQVVGSAPVASRGLQQVIESAADVLLIDAAALRATPEVRTLAQALPSLLIVACGVSEETEEIIACAQSGAAGYVPRDASAADLVNTVRSLERGELPCSPRMASLLFRQLAGTAALDNAASAPLTARERDVVALIERGCSNKEIAAELGIEVATVKNHVHHILEKLAVKRRSAAVAHLRRTPAEGTRLR